MIVDRSKLAIVADDAALARAVADLVVGAGRAAIAARGRFDLALAGGNTPKAAYALLARDRAGDLDWTRVRFFFGDERCVAPTDDESNYHTASVTLLSPLGIDEAHVLRMRGEDDPAAAARAYADVLRETLPANDDRTPVLDLVLLGMGPDGHTASLFPGDDPFVENDALVRAPFVAKFGTYRLTLTPRTIDAARTVAIATAGDAKADALHAVFDGPYQPALYPIAALAPTSGDLRWYVDRAAAAKLVP